MKLRSIVASLGFALGFGLALVWSSACNLAVEQAPVCARYTECVRALDEAAGRETNLDRFDPGGACWGSEEGGLLCERACERGLEWEAERNAMPPQECQP